MLIWHRRWIRYRVLKMKKNVQVFLLTWGTIIIWCLAYIFTKIGLQYFDALSLSVFRYLTAGIAVLLLILIRREKRPALKDIPMFILLGATGFTIYVLTFNYGALTVSVAASSVIISVTPIMTALFAVVLFHEKLNIVQIAAMILEFVGVIIVCMWDGVINMDKGIWWIILAMLSFTAYNILERFATRKYTALQTTEYSLLAAAVMFLFLVPSSVKRTSSYPLMGIISILFMGILCSAAAYAMWSKALSAADKTSDVTNALFLSPLLSSILSFIILKEIPSVGTIAGGIFILIGLVLFSQNGRKKMQAQ